MEDFDYSNLNYIKKVIGNYIFLKNGTSMHCHGLQINTQEDLELEDIEIGKIFDKIKKLKK